MKQGFTLIELLVVVLIIGILSAVALPQYEKAVWNARATQLETAVKQVADAQERFILANGTCAYSFEDFDISFDSLPYKTKGLNTTFFMLYPLNTLTGDGVRGNDDFEVALDAAHIPYRLNSVQFEPDTGYWHYEWKWTVSCG